MIQKIQKAQALSEMALFGSIILLCFYYLLTYLQRVDRQQYLLQESFRSALKKASAPEKGSVAYNIFSNRRQVICLPMTRIYTAVKMEKIMGRK
jgi:hypothetical protein